MAYIAGKRNFVNRNIICVTRQESLQTPPPGHIRNRRQPKMRTMNILITKTVRDEIV